MATEPQKVRSIAGHLAALPDDAVQVYIDDAFMEVDQLGVKDKYKEILTRYLAAHLASLNVRRAQSMSVSDMSKSYAAESSGNGLRSTQYGQEYLRLLRKFGGKPSLNLTVI